MNYNAGNYDVAVIGAGHAGCEANFIIFNYFRKYCKYAM